MKKATSLSRDEWFEQQRRASKVLTDKDGKRRCTNPTCISILARDNNDDLCRSCRWKVNFGLIKVDGYPPAEPLTLQVSLKGSSLTRGRGK